MVKDSKYLEHHFGFTESDILEKYRKSANENELGKLLPGLSVLNVWRAAGLFDRRLDAGNVIQSFRDRPLVLKVCTGF